VPTEEDRMSNKRTIRRNADCTGKRTYPTFTAAAAAARRTDHHRDGDRFAAYRCHHCQHFHVGTQPSGATAARLDRSSGRQRQRRRLLDTPPRRPFERLPATIRRALDTLAAAAKAT
jgi:hypothetical protein